MSKRNWVCFECRTVVRREPATVRVVLCSTCSAPRVDLGYKIRIPPKSRVAEWGALREDFFAAERAARTDFERRRIRTRHELEQEISRLETLPQNPGRRRAVQLLKKRQQHLDS
jgi:hypothetical protein